MVLGHLRLGRGRERGEEASLRVALAGNPNSGKTTIFNALTGSRQHVGNYAGVTVERRVGHYEHEGARVEVIDLPGTYSLSSYSPEERVAQQELLAGEVDVVVVVVDATALKRSLVLMAQLMQLELCLVLCLNMSDEAEASGQKLDIALLQQMIGFAVVETVGSKAQGIDALRRAIAESQAAPLSPSRLRLGATLEDAIAEVRQGLEGCAAELHGLDWHATKLLLEDKFFVDRVQELGEAGVAAVQAARAVRARLEEAVRDDLSLFLTERYYGFVDGLLREVTLRMAREDARELSDRIDAVLVHRLAGLPFFLGVMYAIFWLTFSVGVYPMGWLEALFAWTGDTILTLWPATTLPAMRSLVVDGIIGGVGGVLVFLPNILLLFLGLAFLEDSGYMARAAFLMDRIMHRVGLHGRSFIPLVTGFGCSVPGIMATRTLAGEKDRLTTMFVLPLISCGARLPIWLLLIPAFFSEAWRAPVLWGIYTFGVVVAMLLAWVLRRSVFKGEEDPFVMELPPYRFPTLRAVLFRMFERSWLYLRKAGTFILGVSVVMWFLMTYPQPSTYAIDAEIAAGRVQVAAEEDEADAAPAAATPGEVVVMSAEEVALLRQAEQGEASFAAHMGRAMEPLIAPLGFDARLGTAMLGAFLAKEVFVAQLGIAYSMDPEAEESSTLSGAVGRDYSTLAGISLIIFLLIGTPCMATVAVVRRESGSWKWAMAQFGGLTALAYLLSLAVFQLGSIFV